MNDPIKALIGSRNETEENNGETKNLSVVFRQHIIHGKDTIRLLLAETGAKYEEVRDASDILHIRKIFLLLQAFNQHSNTDQSTADFLKENRFYRSITYGKS